LPPLNLYARVRFLHIFARETAGAACTRLSLRPLISRRETSHNLGRIAPQERNLVAAFAFIASSLGDIGARPRASLKELAKENGLPV
jgi:hypothetical protein